MHLHGVADRGQGVAQLVGEHRQELVLAAVGSGELLGPLPQLALQPPPLLDVVEDQDDAADRVAVAADRGGPVVDGDLRPVAGDQDVWLRQADDPPLAEDLGDRVLDRPPRLLVDQRKTSSSGRPSASSWVQPVSASATGFMKVTAPLASVAITASPMLASVTPSHSRCSRSSSLDALPPLDLAVELVDLLVERDELRLGLLRDQPEHDQRLGLLRSGGGARPPRRGRRASAVGPHQGRRRRGSSRGSASRRGDSRRPPRGRRS